MYDYDTIKELARAEGCRVTDLIALAPQNDPFYAGTPNDHAMAGWFATLWNRFGYGGGVHIRRVHYQIISQDPPVLMPNGKPYENTETCWDILSQASKMARYLELVDPAAFDDRRNPAAMIYADHYQPEQTLSVEDNLWDGITTLPDFPELPHYSVEGFSGIQPYHIEIWCEKSTMNDVLGPLCQTYGAVLQTGLGELSITATLSVANRIAESGKPARIFYVSDFDPAGQSMPVAVSRKLEYFMQQLDIDASVRLFPVVLTAEQVRRYRLPRTPIKESERRAGKFEARFGSGAVELDALEALHPGRLETILRGYIEQYFDPTLAGRVWQERSRLLADLTTTQTQVRAGYATKIRELRETYDALKAEFEERMESYSDELRDLWAALTEEMEDNQPDLEDYPIPEARDATEVDEGLFNSERDYLEQIRAYKEFQGKEPVC